MNPDDIARRPFTHEDAIFVLQAIVRARLEAEDPMGLMALTRAQEEREDFALWEEELRG